ncbi:MAG: hypothetical protein ACE5JU_22510, partial [Candidatus Binatia bacterium]
MNGVRHTLLKGKDGRKVDLYPAAILEDVPAEALEAYPNYEERVCEGCNKTVVVHPPTFEKAKEGSEK